MRDALEVFFEIILALTGAVAFATLIVGGSLLGHFAGAISGNAIARRASFC